ncbi:glutathione S-transferase family protein [Phenylobacterium aquaticum]|uniref:glutathione S-transferase family protein n=1 Tax=Phenylobacterium aquaticum TaxID=1763816 RepID=UPI0026EAD09A|nr:glutathione S-transferase [Phenylobacterium aquaticum]
MTASLVVHHLGISQSERIVWLCEELEIPYELKVYQRDPTTRLAPAEYKALHPMGVAPVITDAGRTLGESGAIVDYIIGRHGNGRLAVKPDQPNFADYVFWLHFANGSFVATEMLGLVANALGVPADHPGRGFMNARSERVYAMVEQRLGEADYFAGDALTAADIMMVFALTTMRMFTPKDLSGFPNILAYLQRIGARPAYRRAMEKGDPGLPPLLT